MIKASVLLIVALFILFFPKNVWTSEGTNCTDRFVTLVNPVRARDYWSDKSLKPIRDQYLDSKKYNFPVTWLLQYDAFKDPELVAEIKKFSQKDELGLFLEISRNAATDSNVIFQEGKKWSDPGVLFLSAYSQSERRRLIDNLYKSFKTEFGYYPKSVGAWWIDSYSLNYIRGKYGLNSVLVVADQKTTDSYGVWGQWWGYPYIPSRYNVLIPDTKYGLGAVVIQWAQRDPVLGFGNTPISSNCSLQANDYIRSGKNTQYFNKLAETYLSCDNKLGQITVGMETGMEASDFRGEYINQISALSRIENLRFVTMSEFSKEFKRVYRNRNPENVKIGEWELTPVKRSNIYLNETIEYAKHAAFYDYFLADKNNFLNRDLLQYKNMETGISKILFYLTIILVSIISIFKKRFVLFLLITSAFFSMFLTILMSREAYGWAVYYGFTVPRIVLTQTILYVFLICFATAILKRFKPKKSVFYMYLASFILSFGLDYILISFRTSIVEGRRIVGFMIDWAIYALRLPDFKIMIFKGTGIHSFQRLPYEKVFENGILSLLVFPIVHLFVSIYLYRLLKKTPAKFRVIVFIVLGLLYILYLRTILLMDPQQIRHI